MSNFIFISNDPTHICKYYASVHKVCIKLSSHGVILVMMILNTSFVIAFILESRGTSWWIGIRPTMFNCLPFNVIRSLANRSCPLTFMDFCLNGKKNLSLANRSCAPTFMIICLHGRKIIIKNSLKFELEKIQKEKKFKFLFLIFIFIFL